MKMSRKNQAKKNAVCRIRTCEGDPNCFRGNRRNHLAKTACVKKLATERKKKKKREKKELSQQKPEETFRMLGGAEGARWAHNPQVVRSKLTRAIFFCLDFFFENCFFYFSWRLIHCERRNPNFRLCKIFLICTSTSSPLEKSKEKRKERPGKWFVHAVQNFLQ